MMEKQPKKGMRRYLWALGLAALACLAVALWWLWRGRSAPPAPRPRPSPRPGPRPNGPRPPRGDRIPGRGFEGTAAPSRVNFREIRDPGVTPQKSKNARKKPAKKEKQLPMRTDASNG